MFKRMAAATKGFFSGGIGEIILILAVIFLIRTFGFGLYQVPTGSMETTMLVGERFFADKFTILFSGVKRGDIISFNEPGFVYSDNIFKRLIQKYAWGPVNYTKRVIGQPGDTVKGVIEDGKPVIYLNGNKLDEPYVNKYPLIHLWLMDPLKVHSLLRRDVSSLIANGVDIQVVGQINEQILNAYSELRSYDPDVPYDKQPFYRMKPADVVRASFLGGDDKPILLYPQTPYYPGSRKVIRKGNNYWSSSDEFYVELGPEEYWLMGDNRRGSQDSRFFGSVKRDLILIHNKI